MPEIQPAHPRARQSAIALVVLGTLGGLLLLAFSESELAALREWVTRDPTRIAARLRLVAAGVGVAFGVPTLLCARYFWRLGRRIVADDRFPPTGTHVVRDTVVLTGHAARWRGRALQGLAAILILAAAGLWMILWRLTSRLVARMP